MTSVKPGQRHDPRFRIDRNIRARCGGRGIVRGDHHRIAPGDPSVITPRQVGLSRVAIDARSITINGVYPASALVGFINCDHRGAGRQVTIVRRGTSLPSAVRANSRLFEKASSARPCSRTLIQKTIIILNLLQVCALHVDLPQRHHDFSV
jgi:hypothetical protein